MKCSKFCLILFTAVTTCLLAEEEGRSVQPQEEIQKPEFQPMHPECEGEKPQEGCENAEPVLYKNRFSLNVNREEAKTIDEIITTLGTNSVFALGFKQGHLKALGKKLSGVGSLQFLGYIFSSEELKTYMVSIRDSSLKWKGFIDGLKPGLNKDLESKKLLAELPGFASFLKVNYAALSDKASEKDWSGFVSTLIKQ